jgi:tRNA G18 (ribose-2'-O)-methylase SpoU
MKQLSHMESNQVQRKFPLALVADGLQSPANVGSLFRVCEAFGIEKIYFCNSRINFDSPRLKKTARNTQDNVPFALEANTLDKVKDLKKTVIPLFH